MFENVVDMLDGSILKCEGCGRTISLNFEKASRYLSNGWPKCCGYTMTLITKKEQNESGDTE